MAKVLKSDEDNGLMFMCPGCECSHQIKYGNGSPPRWTWNNSVDFPTFSPSVLVKFTQMTEKGRQQLQEWQKTPKEQRIRPIKFDQVAVVCHSFVREGKIEFLNDCTHSLAGQTVDLPEWD